MASTRGSGLSTVMYGTSKENVVALTVVTPQGKIVQTRQRVRKSSTGYDLTQLYIGSEGTLGIIVELVLKLRPVPKVRCGALVSFPGIHAAADAVIALVRANLGTLCRCELLNRDGVRASNKKYAVGLPEQSTVFLEFRGTNLAACTAESEVVRKLAEAKGCEKYDFTSDPAAMDSLWEARRGCYLSSITFRDRKGDRVYLSDTCVPISRIAQMIAETEEDFTSHGFPCIICAHIADGNFHCCIPYQPEEEAMVVTLEHRMISRAILMGGTVSGEHGVGIGKIAQIAEEHGEDHINIQRAVKRALDPQNILNPGKVFILPRHEGGCCDVPAIYRKHETHDGSAGTYSHGE